MNKETVEEVAGKSATESHPICMVTVDDTTFNTNHHGMIAHFHGFIAGAEWHEEQSATDAIEFADWCSENTILQFGQSNTRYYSKDQKYYATKELYKIWKSQ